MNFRQSGWVRMVLAGLLAAGARVEARTPASAIPPVLVINPGYRLRIDAERGTLSSFRSTFGAERELLVAGHGRLPLVKIELSTRPTEFRTVTSSEAKKVSVRRLRQPDGETVTLDYEAIGGLPLGARVTIRCPAREALTYWSLEIDNRTEFWIGHVQFPVVEIPFDGRGGARASHLLWSYIDGALASPVVPATFERSTGLDAWREIPRDTPELWRFNNYPGQWASTQLMAHYDEVGGLYLACDDPTGLPKLILPLLDRDGVVLGLRHYPGTRGPGVTRLPYRVVLGAFHGDWYAAAEIYRTWAARQPF